MELPPVPTGGVATPTLPTGISSSMAKALPPEEEASGTPRSAAPSPSVLADLPGLPPIPSVPAAAEAPSTGGGAAAERLQVSARLMLMPGFVASVAAVATAAAARGRR